MSGEERSSRAQLDEARAVTERLAEQHRREIARLQDAVAGLEAATRPEVDTFLAGYDAGKQGVDPNDALDAWRDTGPEAWIVIDINGDRIIGPFASYEEAVKNTKASHGERIIRQPRTSEATGVPSEPFVSGYSAGRYAGENRVAYDVNKAWQTFQRHGGERATSDACLHAVVQFVEQDVKPECKDCGVEMVETEDRNFAPRSGEAMRVDVDEAYLRDAADRAHHADCDCDRGPCTCSVGLAEAALRLIERRSEAAPRETVKGTAVRLLREEPKLMADLAALDERASADAKHWCHVCGVPAKYSTHTCELHNARRREGAQPTCVTPCALCGTDPKYPRRESAALKGAEAKPHCYVCRVGGDGCEALMPVHVCENCEAQPLVMGRGRENAQDEELFTVDPGTAHVCTHGAFPKRIEGDQACSPSSTSSSSPSVDSSSHTSSTSSSESSAAPNASPAPVAWCPTCVPVNGVHADACPKSLSEKAWGIYDPSDVTESAPTPSVVDNTGLCPLHIHQEDGGPCFRCPDYTGPRATPSSSEADEDLVEAVMKAHRSAWRSENGASWFDSGAARDAVRALLKGGAT